MIQNMIREEERVGMRAGKGGRKRSKERIEEKQDIEKGDVMKETDYYL